MIGIAPYIWLPLMRRAMSKPWSSGSIASRMIRSGTCSFTMRSARRPAVGLDARGGLCLRGVARASLRISASSSTTSTSAPACSCAMASLAACELLAEIRRELRHRRDVRADAPERVGRHLDLVGRARTSGRRRWAAAAPSAAVAEVERPRCRREPEAHERLARHVLARGSSARLDPWRRTRPTMLRRSGLASATYG